MFPSFLMVFTLIGTKGWQVFDVYGVEFKERYLFDVVNNGYYVCCNK